MNIRNASPDDLVALVRRLIATQFPHWSDLPVRAVTSQGNDNRTFRLGEDMSVRLPSAQRYVAGVEKEQSWLPLLATQLPLAIPVPLAMGEPGEGYAWRWSIHRWLDGETAAIDRIADLAKFATALAQFLSALQRIDPAGGPPAGAHSFFRGAPLAHYDEETRAAIRTLEDRIDAKAAMEVWDAACAASWRGAPVWFHGDVQITNFLVQDGKLACVIDFGQCGIGDPACDLAIAWTMFAGESRQAFRAALPLDAGTSARARGWALWKALIRMAREPGERSLWTHNVLTGNSVIEEVIHG
jgi:aminoglycoside phosphotransferase (APT) family kinase protein